MRTVLFHYHYFKNAGTSVDAVLQRNFGSRWIAKEFPSGHKSEMIAEWIKSNPQADAFSSHTALFPLPILEGVRVYPIVFIRHPLDRINSVYSFERTQKEDTFGTLIAREHDLAGYILKRLEYESDRQLRNFHSDKLARLVPGPQEAELDRALSALKQLPFVGIVEEFETSMAMLECKLRPLFPSFTVFTTHENASRTQGLSLEERLNKLRETLGEDLWSHVLDANLADIALYYAARVRAKNKSRTEFKDLISAQQ